MLLRMFLLLEQTKIKTFNNGSLGSGIHVLHGRRCVDVVEYHGGCSQCRLSFRFAPSPCRAGRCQAHRAGFDRVLCIAMTIRTVVAESRFGAVYAVPQGAEMLYATSRCKQEEFHRSSRELSTGVLCHSSTACLKLKEKPGTRSQKRIALQEQIMRLLTFLA